MIKGERIALRPVRDGDWDIFEEWGRERAALWGEFQRFQLDHLPALHQAYQKGALLSRNAGLLLIQRLEDEQVVGFVRYTLIPYPDADNPCPEIGFGIPESTARSKGYAREAVGLLVNYLFAGYPVPRITAFTEVDNLGAQRVMESVGFEREGVLRKSMFRDGSWRDIALYGMLRKA